MKPRRRSALFPPQSAPALDAPPPPLLPAPPAPVTASDPNGAVAAGRSRAGVHGGPPRLWAMVWWCVAVCVWFVPSPARAMWVTYNNETYFHNAVALAFLGPRDFNLTAPGALAQPFNACNGQDVDLTGRIVVVVSDGCTQETKLRHVRRAGAVGIIIYFSAYSTDTTGWDTYLRDRSSRSDLDIPLVNIGYEFKPVVTQLAAVWPRPDVIINMFPGHNLWLPLWNGALYFTFMYVVFPVWAMVNTLLASWRLYCFVFGHGTGGCQWNLAQITMAVEILANAERVVIGPTFYVSKYCSSRCHAARRSAALCSPPLTLFRASCVFVALQCRRGCWTARAAVLFCRFRCRYHW